jgi:hypothetical protein
MTMYRILTLKDDLITSKMVNSESVTFTFAGVKFGASGPTLTNAGVNFDFGGVRLTNIAQASAASDAVSKAQMDNAISAALADYASGLQWQDAVLDILSDPPASPANGDRYLIASPATGAWLGKEDNIAEWTGTAWVFTVPEAGMFLPVIDQPSNVYQWGGASWIARSWESTTASGGLTKVGMDIRLADTVAGNGLDLSGGVLSVVAAPTSSGNNAASVLVTSAGVYVLVDNSSIVADAATKQLKVGPSGITASHIATSALGNGLSGGAGSPISVNLGTGLVFEGSAIRTDDIRSFQAYESLAAGDICMKHSSGKIAKFLPSAYIPGTEVLIAAEAIGTDVVGKFLVKPGSYAVGYTGLVANEDYYCGSSGSLLTKVQVASLSAGDHVVLLGRAVSATTVNFCPRHIVEL